MWLQDTNDLTCRVKKNLGDGKVLFKGKIILVRLAMETFNESTCDTVYTHSYNMCSCVHVYRYTGSYCTSTCLLVVVQVVAGSRSDTCSNLGTQARYGVYTPFSANE